MLMPGCLIIEPIVIRKLEGVKHFHYYLCRQPKGGGMEINMEKESKNASNLSFWELINKFRIEIPIIQRDYAQGREEHKTVSGNFPVSYKHLTLPTNLEV